MTEKPKWKVELEARKAAEEAERQKTEEEQRQGQWINNLIDDATPRWKKDLAKTKELQKQSSMEQPETEQPAGQLRHCCDRCCDCSAYLESIVGVEIGLVMAA